MALSRIKDFNFYFKFVVSHCSLFLGIQATQYPDIGCYWSSWFPEWNVSKECKDFLKIEAEDKCLGLFCVGSMDKKMKDARRRPNTDDVVDWRLDQN